MAVLSTLVWSTLGFTALITLYGLWSAVCLFRNYLIARKIGVPIKIIPICHSNPFWVMGDKFVLSIVRKLPLIGGENTFTRYNWRGWEWVDKYRTHREVGQAYIIVTPSRIWFYTADPDSVVDFLRRKNEFPRCVDMTKMLNVFGPNISTVEEAEWNLQRKMVGTCLNEQMNQVVWSESLALGHDMLHYWASKPSITSTADDLRTLALHVLSKAGFGKSYKFEGHDERQVTSRPASHKNALQTILEYCILIVALGPKFFANSWLPGKLRKVGEACDVFQNYMTETYEEAKRTVAQGKSSASSSLTKPNKERTFMTALIQASQDEATRTESSTGGLTEQQIYGNMFVLNFAGHDTTAHTFTFALYLLAAHPRVQDWISEEVAAVLGPDPSTWADSVTYSAAFPRLKRCLAVMLETIRLYTPVPVSKWTGTDKNRTMTQLVVGGKTLLLPSELMIIPSYACLQTEPAYWGEDSLEWRPERWIQPSETKGRVGAGEEELISPRRGTFIGWSEGARDCPGKKFSQVEFVATMASLFGGGGGRWRVDPVVQEGEGETLDAARKRVLRLVEEDTAPVLLLQMLHPERAPLVWTKK